MLIFLSIFPIIEWPKIEKNAVNMISPTFYSKYNKKEP